METNNEKFGSLFGSIDLLSEEHLELILSTMDINTSIYYLIESVKSAHRKGAFTIGETEVLSKAIRILLKQPEDK
jgi:2-hydroxy-3-keto-5-methylthiopentenyl-1-phosphate phosphatase